MQSGILPLNKETLNHLKLKHPETNEPSAEVLLDDVADEVHVIKFEAIDEESMRQAALKTRVGSGPSGLDFDDWRSILISQNFGKSKSGLQKVIARCIKVLCTEKHDPQ